MTDPKLHDEVGRMATLRQHELLDTPSEPAFDRITSLVKTVLSVPICAVSIIDSDRQWFKSCVGLDSTETSRDISFCTHTITARVPMNIADATADPRFAANPLVTGTPHIRSYLGIPLSSRDGFNLGALCVIDTQPRTFEAAQIEVLKSFADLVMNEMELRRIAQVDYLTGVSSRRGFILEADKAIEHFVRNQTPAALLLLDLDYFKGINDTYGHPAGDVVLRSVGNQLTSFMKSTYAVGRLGGEEFGILLPGYTLDDAAAIAEGLRLLIEKTEIEHDPPLRMTASLGVASLTERCLSFENWLACADQGLYAAKRTGRNRICTV